MSACEQGAPGNTRQTVHPEFWRSSQQQNCRSFQNLDIRTIFGILLKEMDIRTHDILLRGMSPLPYNPNAANESSDYCINSLRCTAQIRSARVTAQDYTFTAPNWQVQYSLPNQRPEYEVFDYSWLQNQVIVHRCYRTTSFEKISRHS